MFKSRILNVANISLNAFCENKILSKISEFTVMLLKSFSQPLTGFTQA